MRKINGSDYKIVGNLSRTSLLLMSPKATLSIWDFQKEVTDKEMRSIKFQKGFLVHTGKHKLADFLPKQVDATPLKEKVAKKVEAKKLVKKAPVKQKAKVATKVTANAKSK